ncbi:(r)-specific enoyl-coa hydratase [Phtheirospermum japonicum]|uniref:(R)-specific enoyl-coa hydratase n=1 Tax=Phtheirospermum japonicum TaxID=374723 RepID=A0A830DPR2_9LAMI|nr:(r)-specific enoyl-coa hydratase [Phtheirospermum japonicum]
MIKLLNSISKLRCYSSSASNILKSGDILKQSRIFSTADISEYSKLTRDINPLHFDMGCATKAGFKDIPVPGMLVASLFPRIIASRFPGAVYAKQTLEFKSPVFVGDEIVGEVEASVVRRMNGNSFVVKFATRCFKGGDDNNVVVISGEATAILPTLDVKMDDS